jgi:hypothetical protein
VQLSIDAQDCPAREHHSRIVKVPVVAAFREADDRGHPVARERCECAGQLIRPRLNRHVIWPIDVVCQPAQEGFGAAKDCYTQSFAPIDLLADQ